ncbi:MAG: DUF4974 domain-containing protein, partial [Marinoscillum sp.]
QMLSQQLGQTKVIPLYTKVWRLAAAILLPLLSIGALLYFYNQQSTDPLAGIDEVIVPGREQAILTLSNGSQVVLSDTASQSEITQGSAVVRNQQKQLVYAIEATASQENTPVYNQLETPIGGTYKLVLSDGTKVKLNAGSTLRYPVTFPQDTRVVELSGEGYFEVTHTGSPFRVVHAAQEVEVLGTSFNVTGYPNDPQVQTTLVDGSVRIKTADQQQLLVPGEQSVLSKDDGTIAVNVVSTTNYTAWTKGKFQFNNDSMEEVMQRLSRWYGFEFEFSNAEARGLHFTGRINNDQQISSILNMLEVTTAVTFDRQGKTIIIQ